MLGHRLSTIVVAYILVALSKGGRVPDIPSGRRTQYHFLLDNGGYKYGYDTGSGLSEKALANEANQVVGSYSYQSPSGLVSVDYTSGVEGFTPTKVVIPQDSQWKSQGNQWNRDSIVTYAATPSSHKVYQPPTIVQPYSYSYSSFGQGAAHGHSHDESNTGDASYSFSYNAGDHDRKESSDAAGNVVGSYSYVGTDGQTKKVEYEAGAEKGFIAKGNHLPDAAKGYQAALTSQSYGSSGYATSGHIPLIQQYSGESKGDASYSFSYNAGDHDRKESSDAAGNVVGSYSFVGTDGQTKKVDYEAGAEKGFIAKGNHLPDSQGGQYVQSYTPAVYAAGHVSSGVAGQAHQVHQVGQYTPVQSYTPVNYAASGHSQAGDASYSFSYNAGDHNRQENSDASGNVVGSYSFLGTDGQTKKVDYVAGAGQGFIAKGAHLPVSQVHQVQYTPVQSYTPVNYAASGQSQAGDASYSFSYNAGDHYRQENSDASGNVVGSYSFFGTDGQTKKVDYVAGAGQGFIAKGAHLPVSQAHQVQYTPVQSYTPVNYAASGHSQAGDASYSFSYNAGDHNRQENSDASGNVVGSYSFLGTDGQTKKVDYVAGAGQGFIAKGAHLPVPQVHQVQYTPVQSYAASVPSSYESGHSQESAGDASYSFSYNAGDHNRQESSDATGNIVGSYSFVGTDGQTKKVDYVAGAEKGFIAKGNHLPQPPSASAYSGLSIHTPVTQLSHTGQYNADHAAKSHLPKVQSLFAQSYQPSATITPSVQQYSLGGIKVKTLLTPNSHRKVGYIFDS